MYGRARRIQALKTLGIAVAVIVVIVLSAMFFINFFAKRNAVDNFQTMKKFMKQKGYDCELIEHPGEACKYTRDDILARFVRYEDGFSYNMSTNAYYIEIKHTKDDSKFIFRTTDEALKGYKNKIYKCTYEGSIIDKLKECKDEDDRVLDSVAYQGEVESFMNELALILKGSGYNVDKLLKDYQWVE